MFYRGQTTLYDQPRRVELINYTFAFSLALSVKKFCMRTCMKCQRLSQSVLWQDEVWKAPPDQVYAQSKAFNKIVSSMTHTTQSLKTPILNLFSLYLFLPPWKIGILIFRDYNFEIDEKNEIRTSSSSLRHEIITLIAWCSMVFGAINFSFSSVKIGLITRGNLARYVQRYMAHMT